MLDQILNNPLVLWGAVVVAVLFAYQKLAPRMSIRVPGGSVTREDLLSRFLGSRFAEAKMERTVQKLKKQGDFLAAGKVLEDAGKTALAAEAYLEGNEFWAAAATYERLGKHDKAAELYLQAGDYKKAAQLMVSAGKPGRAAVLFQEKGNNLEAARLYGLAGDWTRAADLYAKSGYPLRAAEAYEKKGEFLKAAEAHEKHFMENVSFSTTYSSTVPSVDQKSALHAGRLYEKAADLNRAFQVYSKGGYFKEAAGALMQLKQYRKAAELYMRAEDPDSAAKAFEAAGDPVQAANLLGEVAFKGDRPAEAAAYFVRGKDYLRAAELYESVGLLAEAAGAYEAGDSYPAAGSVYIRAGLKEKAAAAYERGGEYETAAKLYEEAGNGTKATELFGKAGLTFKSGEAAFKAGEKEKAIALLQRVGTGDENYRPATELLARLFIETGMPHLAIERVQNAIAGQPVSPTTLDLYYWLAIAHEASGSNGEALSVYKKIQSEDFQFRDVAQRVARIGAKGAAPGITPREEMPAAGGAAPTAAAPTPSPSRPAGPAPTTKGVARFTPKEEIGRGPLGVILRGEDSVDGRPVALRLIPNEALKGEGVLQAVVADLKAAAQLSHPNLVKVIGLMELQGQRCLVTELVVGKSFAEALKSGRRMTFQQVHGLGRVLASTLAFIHGKGLVHGSIQPSNVMVANGVVKVSDLGLGRLGQAQNGEDSYRPPENRLDVAGDLFAMAGVLYHLLTGTHPKSQPQGVGLPLPSKLTPGVPENFDKLLLRCLHPRPELRFATAEEIQAELKEMVRIG
jgi:tetratricopeptide (TPR) repeat protein